MNYNKLQQEAIDNDSPKIVVVAPPGSGKTHSLVGAISKYAEEHPFDRITAITFTRKAASELQFKLNDKTQVDTRTIHSWSLAELNRLAAKHKFKVDILSDIQVQEILQFLCKRLGYYSINYYLLTAFVMGNYNIDVKDKENFPTSVDKLLDKEKKVAVYCRSGRRSRTAAVQLTQKGFKDYNLNEGILHWKEKGTTIVK